MSSKKCWGGIALLALSFATFNAAHAYTITVDTVKQFDAELNLDASDQFGYGGLTHLFTDPSGNQWVAGAAHLADGAGNNAGAAYVRSVSNTGLMISGSLQELDTEIGLQTGDQFGLGGVSYLFQDDNGNHWLGGGAHLEDTDGNAAGAAFIWAMSNTGVFSGGSVQQLDVELNLQAGDRFGEGGISYLFTDPSGNRWLGGGAKKEATAGSEAGAVIIWSMSSTGQFMAGSAEQFDTELSLQNWDRFGRGGVSYLFTDPSGNYWLGAGATDEDTAGETAGAAYIWAVTNTGQFVAGSAQQFDTELNLQSYDRFGEGGISHLFTGSEGYHWLAGGAYGEDTPGTMAGTIYVWAVTNTGQFVAGSLQELDNEIGVQAGDQAGKGKVSYLFTDNNGDHWIGAGGHMDGASNGGSVFIWAMTSTGQLVADSAEQFNSELSVQGSDYLGYAGTQYLFYEADNKRWLGAGAYGEDTAGDSAGAGYLWSITGVPDCGDNTINDLETCDDGNTTAGDGCSATCTIESGYVCNEEPSVCTNPNTGEGQTTIGLSGGSLTLLPICDLDFGTISQSLSQQTLTGAMACNIAVQDLKGSYTGWTVTMSMDDLNAFNIPGIGTGTIDSQNLSIDSSSGTAAALSGSTTNTYVKIPELDFTTDDFDNGAALTILYKNNGQTSEQIGTYGFANPAFQLVLAGGTPAATYTGAITVTLTEN